MPDLIHIQQLTTEVKSLIERSRQNVAVTVNSEITGLYWTVGRRIKEELLSDKRAEYGKQVISELSRQLMVEYGKGWGRRHLHYCLRFVEIFPNFEIVNALRSQLSWTHFRITISIDDELKRSFYIEETKSGNDFS